MPRHLHVTRRAVLGGASWAAVALVSTAVAPATASVRPSAPAAAARRRASHNGWTIEEQVDDVSTVWTRPVSGTAMTVPVRLGVAEALLIHLVRRMHYEITPLLPGDLTGWEPLGSMSTLSPASNLASGTAVRVRPGARSDAYFPFQETVLRDILADAHGAIRWGGDDIDRDDSLFYLVEGPYDMHTAEVAQQLRAAAEAPGQGSGVVHDPLITSRRSAAQALQRRQSGR